VSRVVNVQAENPELTIENLKKKDRFFYGKAKSVASFVLSCHVFLSGDLTALKEQKENPSFFIDLVYRTDEPNILRSFCNQLLELIGGKEEFLFTSKTPKFFINYVLDNMLHFGTLFQTFWNRESNIFRDKYEDELKKLKKEALKKKTAYFDPSLFEKFENGSCPRISFENVKFEGKSDFCSKNLNYIDEMVSLSERIKKELKTDSYLMSEILLGKRDLITTMSDLMYVVPENVNTIEVLNH